jgi:hypothetical protein
VRWYGTRHRLAEFNWPEGRQINLAHMTEILLNDLRHLETTLSTAYGEFTIWWPVWWNLPPQVENVSALTPLKDLPLEENLSSL